jgi:hypothetical protein
MTTRAPGFFIRFLIAGILSIVLLGCGTYSRHGRYGHVHSRGGGGSGVALAVGVLAGAAIVAASSSSSDRREPEPERVYVNNVYYVNGPPAPTPRSTRDEVKDSGLPAFDPQAARVALNNIDVSGCREAGAPKGYGHAMVTFNPDGRISKVHIDVPTGLSQDAASCIGDRMGTATITPFKGSLVTMGTTYRVL